MTWFLYATTTALLYTAWNILSRVLSVKSESPRAFGVIYALSAALFAVIFFAFQQQPLRALPMGIILLTVAAIFVWGIYGRTEFYATKHVEASTLTIVGKVAPLITFIISILVFRETVTALKLVAATLIIGGNVLAVYQKGKITNKSGLIYALITASAAGVGWAFDKYLSVYFPLALYVIMTYALPVVFVAFFPTLTKEDFVKEFKRDSWKIVLLAIFGVSGYYFQLKAFAIGEASSVILVVSTSSILTILLGIILLHETKNLTRKILAGILVCVGIILMGY